MKNKYFRQRPTTVRFKDDEYEKIMDTVKQLAEASDRSVNWMMANWIKQGIAQELLKKNIVKPISSEKTNKAA